MHWQLQDWLQIQNTNYKYKKKAYNMKNKLLNYL